MKNFFKERPMLTVVALVCVMALLTHIVETVIKTLEKDGTLWAALIFGAGYVVLKLTK